MPDPVAEFKERARGTWASGDWDAMAEIVAPVGPKLLDRVGVEQGMDLLDVGTGSGGTVAIPAAQRGAKVVGSDLTPELLSAARPRAAKAGVEIEWVEADAEELPFEDESFDRVLSTFGHMFAPRHAHAGAELARVCRAGGVVGTVTWRAEGSTGGMFKAIGSYVPPPPDFVESPLLWGSEQHVREMLEPHGLELEFHREHVKWAAESAEDLVRLFEENYGPVFMAKAAVGNRWPELRRDLVHNFETWNQAEDGSMDLKADYLETVGRK